MTTTQPVSGPSLPFPVTPRRPGDPECDLSGFRIIHRALRSGSRLLADRLSAVAAGGTMSPAEQEAIGTFAEHVLKEIDSHHRKEDDILWPVIAVSAGPHVDLTPLSDDHTALHAVLTKAVAAHAEFVRSGSPAAPPFAALMTEIADELDEHIEDEEATVFPVMTAYVSKADFAACEKLFQKGASGKHLMFLLPWVLDNCTPEEKAGFLAEAPLPLKLMLKLATPRWEKRRALVAGRQ